jgi:hypothetical protein
LSSNSLKVPVSCRRILTSLRFGLTIDAATNTSEDLKSQYFPVWN